jgi:CRP/FNR family cyclic AMP-dependent transcriptional regulator
MFKPMNEAAVLSQIRLVPLFAQLPAADLQAVARTARSVTKTKAARLFEEGSVADCCFILTSGRVKVVLTGHRGAEVILGMIEPPAVIGEIALLDHSPRSAGLVAVADSHFIAIPRASFDRLRGNPAFEDRLVAHVTSTLRRATEQIRAMYTFSSADRLAWCLAQVARQRGEKTGDTIRISPKPPHHELADMTGCSRETVSRALLRFRRQKWLRWDKDALHVKADLVTRYSDQPQADPDVIAITRLV